MASGIESRSPFFCNMGCSPPIPLSWPTTSATSMPDRKAEKRAARWLGLGGHGMPGFADGRENLERLAVHLVHREIHAAEPGLHLLREPGYEVGALAHAHLRLFCRLCYCGGARGQHLRGFAAVAVDRHALAAFFIGHPVNGENVVARSRVGQVYGLGHGVVRVALESRCIRRCHSGAMSIAVTNTRRRSSGSWSRLWMDPSSATPSRSGWL